jgi:osmotically-inducible protein OsmY
MSKSTDLQRDVEQELRWDPSVNAEQVGVTVNGEVVELTGKVNGLWEKWAAENAALRVKNVKAVANEITVEGPFPDNCADTDIAKAAISHLEWNYSVPDTVKVTVSNGWITLEGTVEAQYEKTEAERALRSLSGVKGILNQINVKPQVSVSVVATNISDAFKRSAALDASHIHVEASAGSVTLRGNVRTWAERSEAERTAWCAPGVTSVDDLLVVN